MLTIKWAPLFAVHLHIRKQKHILDGPNEREREFRPPGSLSRPVKSEWREQPFGALQGCVKSQHCLSVQFVGVSSPPVQCSNTGFKMRYKKCEILIHPSNIWESYSHALEQGCLKKRRVESTLLFRSLLATTTTLLASGQYNLQHFFIFKEGDEHEGTEVTVE